MFKFCRFRAKDASPEQISTWTQAIIPLCEEHSIPLIINDHPALAGELHVAGCHVGQDDLSVEEARRLAGPGVLIGKSTHSPEQALAAVQEGADYLGVGPIYATPTKPTYVPTGLAFARFAAENITLPFFCIGGIKLENLREVIATGVLRVVIVSGLLKAEQPAQYAAEVRRLLALYHVKRKGN